MALGRRLEVSTASKEAPTSPDGSETVRLLQAGAAKESAVNDLVVTATGGSTARTLAARAADWYGASDEGAAADGSTNDRVSIVTAAGDKATVYLPRGTIYITEQLALTLTRNTSFIGHPDGTTLKFGLSGHSDSCIKVVMSGDYWRVRWYNIDFDYDETGLDGYEQTSGHYEFHGCKFKDAYRDFEYQNLVNASYGWIENCRWYDCEWTDAGRHVLHVYMSGDSIAALPFSNEGRMINCEVRGIGRRYDGTENGGAGCNLIRVTFDTTPSTAKFGAWRFFGGNFDADAADSLAGTAIGHVIEAVAINSGLGVVEDIDFRGAGGIESTTGTVSGKKAIVAAAGLTVQRIYVDMTPYNWGHLPSDDILNLISTEAVNSSTGKYYQKFLAKPNGKTIEGDGAGTFQGFTKVLVGTTTDVSNYSGIFDGGILTRGSNATVAIYRRDTDALAWTIYSTGGDLDVYSNVAGVSTWQFDTAKRFRPSVDLTSEIGVSNRRLTNAWLQKMSLIDGITAPSAATGHAQIYIDSADGDLKIIFADGTIKTIVTDT